MRGRKHIPGSTSFVQALCAPTKGFIMYAVIRTGGKQYAVSPGETLKIERTAHTDGAIEFSDVLAVSGEEGKFESSLAGATRHRHRPRRRPWRQNPRLQAEAQEAVQKDAGTSPELRRSPHQRDLRQRQDLQRRDRSRKVTQRLPPFSSRTFCSRNPISRRLRPATQRQKWHIKKV